MGCDVGETGMGPNNLPLSLSLDVEPAAADARIADFVAEDGT